MRVLITNDDGFHAEGVQALAEAFGPDHEVWLVAPDREQSATSRKLTLHEPLRLREEAPRRYAINGTPTDAVYVGVHHLMPERPDVILSGINRGPNMGDDITYSGTVAAAMEGTVLGIPSIAVSMAGFDNLTYGAAGKVARFMAQKVAREGLPPNTLLNINVPIQQTESQIRIQYTRLGKRNYGQFVVERRDPRGKPYYWIGGDALGFEDVAGSDINAVEAGFVSITPISLDLTAHAFLETMKNWETSL